MIDVFSYVNANGRSLELSVSNGYKVETVTGANGIPVSVSTAQGVGQVGETIQSEVPSKVPMTISGMILGTPSEVNDRANALMEIILPAVRGKLYHNGTYYRNVTPTTTPTIEHILRWPHFQFSLIAAYPYWLKDQSTKTFLTGVVPKFKFPWNISKPYRFGEFIETAFINIQNSGQIPCTFTATFTGKGTCVNPRIINAVTGQYMKLNRTIVTGEIVTVEITHDLTYVTSSIDGDIRGDLDITNTLWRMAAGDNLIKTEADSGAANVTVSKIGRASCRERV